MTFASAKDSGGSAKHGAVLEKLAFARTNKQRRP